MRRESIYFCNVNRNKSSLALDLKSDAGRAELLARVRDADVVVENFRAGTADRLGIGYAALRAVNPRLVYCAITGYGQYGSLSAMPGHDLNVAAMSGLLQLHEGQVPQMPNVLMADYAASTAALTGILAGLVAARTQGVGSFIDIAMLDALSAWTGVHMTGVFAAGCCATSDVVEGWGGNPRYNLYRTRDDRYLAVSLLERDLWARFCNAFGRADLINPNERDEDRLTAHGGRADDYRRFLAELLLQDDRDAWARRFRELDLPVTPVNTLGDWYRSDIAREREAFATMPVPGFDDELPQVGFAFRMTMADGANAFARRAPPPVLDNARAMPSDTGSDA